MNSPTGNDMDEYLALLQIDEEELRSRLDFFELTEDDVKRLESLKDFSLKYTDSITEALYELLLRHPETSAFFPDESVVTHVKGMQNAYFKQLFCARYDLNYVKDRLRVGAVHERIRMPPKWYLGAYRRYIDLIHKCLREHYQGRENEVILGLSSIRKIIFFDMALAIDTYIAAYLESMTRDQAEIRELSTPVIKVYRGILLLPIIGVIDTGRAKQIMEMLLMKTIEEQASAVIIDIAGVPMVDSKIADHLVNATDSIRLLGARAILTGISAEVARTMVELGVNIRNMTTTANLSRGIEVALSMVGKRITSSKKTSWKAEQRR